MNNITTLISRFVVLLLLQVLIMNNIRLTGWDINPHLYIVFILIVPNDVPKWLVLVLSFFLGLSIDIFTDTTGLHMAACTLIAFARYYVLQLISARDSYETGSEPNLHNHGLVWFSRYTVVLVFLHQFAYYFLDAFSLKKFFLTFVVVLIATVISSAVIVLSQFFMFKK